MATRYGTRETRGQRSLQYSGSNRQQTRVAQRMPAPVRRQLIDDPDANLSSFYRDRFGSHSPEEYMNLRFSHFDGKLSKDEIKVVLERELRRFTPFEVKIVRNPSDDQRLAYVNFERPDAARAIRHTMLVRLQRFLGKRLHLDPAGIIRDQEGKYIPDRYNRALQAERDREKKDTVRRKSPSRRHDDGGMWNLKEDDSDATRTLFVGNLPVDIRESEIRRVFERYGKVEDVDIKTPFETNAAYAFVLFQTLEQSMHAKGSEHDRPIRPGASRCKIGYGKSQPSNRLWIGGLGPWTSPECLAKEFDRYGLIDRLEYEEGADFAYIRFTDLNAAMDACRAMKGFPLGGRDRCIIVDFAKDEQKEERKRRRSETYLPRKRQAKGPHTPSDSPASGQWLGEEGDELDTIEELSRCVAPTWQGVVMLKKTEFCIRLHRIWGTEHLLQHLLRDANDGSALRLHISQRLPLASQEALEQRLMQSSKHQLCLMVAVACERTLRPLVNYLCEKDAVGVISVPTGVLYVFATSRIADNLIQARAPRVTLFTPDCGHLLFALAVKPDADISNGI